MDNRPIGLLDSGVGGLTVLRQIMRRLPNENTIFIGDQARLPYGTKSAATILQFGRQLVTFLQNQNVKLIVIACNTVTAVALPRLQKEFTVPIIGVIAAGSQAAVKATHNQKIGVIATPATIESQAYQKALQQLQPQIQVHGLATPEFVSLVESCQYHSVKTQAIVTQTLQPLLNCGMDTLILGCTHFPLLQPLIQQAVGQQVQIIDAGLATAHSVIAQLQQNQLLAAGHLAQHQFYTTGDPQKFMAIANDWLAPFVIQAQHLEVSELEEQTND